MFKITENITSDSVIQNPRNSPEFFRGQPQLLPTAIITDVLLSKIKPGSIVMVPYVQGKRGEQGAGIWIC